MVELLTPDEAAKALSLSKKMLKQLADEGRLERVKIGHRTVRYTRASVERFGGGQGRDDTQGRTAPTKP